MKKLEAGCGADVNKFCSSVTPGEGRLFFCIMAHQDKISTKCDYALFEASRSLDRALDRVELEADACWNDIEKLCASISGRRRPYHAVLSQQKGFSIRSVPGCH